MTRNRFTVLARLKAIRDMLDAMASYKGDEHV